MLLVKVQLVMSLLILFYILMSATQRAELQNSTNRNQGKAISVADNMWYLDR